MSTLKIAVQKSGRLNDDSIGLLKNCGIHIDNGKDQLKASASNFPMDVLYLRNGDIPQYVEDGVADIAIVGENLLVEAGNDIEVVRKLGFSKCKLSLAVPKELDYEGVQYFDGKRIATSYPNTLQQYLDQHNVKADIHVIKGSVEIAPNIGLAEGICDLVSSGSTLFKNGLKEADQILISEAVLVKSKKLTPEQEELLDTLLFRLDAVQKGKKSKYVLMNVPNDKIDGVINMLPGMRSPTVLPLAEAGWSSVHTVIEEGKFWEVIDQLKAAGAEGILIVPIEKMVL
ncbi:MULTISPECIES: ATP phosphoribosyltransferase [Reichenbachiella]|uniref:ATP phosphoribosyltransferase n=1 Tax=Reichenbachiella agariperforans TaxID=156994 RepID=A0A1M6NK47_REIAG|nr:MULTISPECIES: ATP phosphoribosyltransferase [Reichenbachiella]MBU2915910.1 ATP phosphoribosyltransferase [Reichenbachiella agariperforans]PIB36771.1 ATP phosphoribosyltransferase [Reichenbachiella sp. 5M10]RJE72125.1 ATP phosphoribosyltransferase [Reichenbachiella sp. MSK19-1]SHJ96121.1 ATP phosphoribosyltransferase [Reichenbachiella agariperforans]